MAAKKAPGNNGPETSDDAAKGAAAKKSPRGGAKAGGKSGTSVKAGASIGVVGMLRWFWRQLTTMRTALFLLLLVAIAAVPGSIFPQRSIDATRVTQYEQDHPDLFPWLDRLGMFNVYSTPWFAAIYLLLAVSLIGCIIPRTKVHWKAMRSGPPKMPRNIKRLPAHRSETVDASPDAVAEAALVEGMDVGGASSLKEVTQWLAGDHVLDTVHAATTTQAFSSALRASPPTRPRSCRSACAGRIRAKASPAVCSPIICRASASAARARCF